MGFDNKHITYPAHLAFSLVQYTVEHFSAEFPTLASLNGLLVVITVALAPFTYYKAWNKTTGPKILVLAAIASFPIILGVFKGLELGFPKDDPAQQALANLDRMHSLWHVALHVAVLLNGMLTTAYVPWSASGAALVPGSPKATTKKATSQWPGSAAQDCAPSSPAKGAF